MTLIKNMFRRFSTSAKENLGAWLFSCFLIAVVTLLRVTSTKRSTGIELSLADGFVMVGSGFTFYCNSVLLPILLIILLTKRNFSITTIIHYNKAKLLWTQEAFYAFFLSVFFALYQLLAVFLLISPYSVSGINFDDRHSNFSFSTNGRTISTLHLYQLVSYEFAFIFITGFLILLIFLLFKWWFSRIIWPLILIILLAFMDSTYIFGPGKYFGVYYHKWLSYNPLMLVIPLLLCVWVFLIGYFFSGRKEFLNAK